MKKLLIVLGLLLAFVGNSWLVTPVFGGNDWLAKEKEVGRDGYWVLYEDGSIKKVMQLPYGHDKDSDREGSDRGRPIREAELKEIANHTQFTEHRILYAQQRIALKHYNSDFWKWDIEQEQRLKNRDKSYSKFGEPMRRNGVESIGYTVTVPEGCKKDTTFRITATLTSVNDYYSVTSHHVDSITNKEIGVNEPLQYKAGGVINEQTHEIVVGNDNTLFSTYASTAPMREQVTGLRDGNTFFFAYTPPKTMLIGRDDIYANVTITITETKSGISSSITYPQTLRILN